jgi:hypothetical protein
MDFAMIFFKECKSKGINGTNKEEIFPVYPLKPAITVSKDKIQAKGLAANENELLMLPVTTFWDVLPMV